MADIITLNTPLRVTEQAPAGTHEFPPMADIDITGALEGYQVWLRGKRFGVAGSWTRASRLKTALETLDSYGLLGCVQTPQEAVRAMLVASLCDPEGAA